MAVRRNIPRQDLVTAYPDKRDAAERLGHAIDDLGEGAERGDGVLQPGEIKKALEGTGDGVQRDATVRADRNRTVGGQDPSPLPVAAGADRPTVRGLMIEVMGEQAAARFASVEDFVEEVETEKAVQGIRDEDLDRTLEVLCKDPVLALREAGHPDYIKSAQWVARELERYGAKPLGDIKDGKRTYLQAFRWEERFESSKISKSYNVVGLFEGTDPEPREAVLVIAHLDNLSAAEKRWYESRGTDLDSYEGANDNTSCVAAVLEAAQAMQDSGPCRRDVIVLIPSAEEDGLKGTEAFVQAPPIDLDRVRGAVNLEMIGRNATDELLLFGGDNAREVEINPLYDRALRVANEHGTTLKPGHRFDDNQNWWRRSDHYVTAKMGIPSVMLHGRASPDSYHTSSDTKEALNMEKIRVTARHLFRLVRDLANDPDPAEQRVRPHRPLWGSLTGFPGKVWPGEG